MVLGGHIESLWLPESLLETSSQQRLADALFAASRMRGSNCTSTRDSPERLPMRSRDREGHRHESSGADRIRAGDRRRRAGTAYPGIAGHEPSVDDWAQSRRAHRSDA